MIAMFAYVPAAPLPGTGHAVVTDRFVCLLGDESDAGVAIELYRLLDLPSTTLADVVDVFAMHGGAKRFAIVEVLDRIERVVRVAVSGDLGVDLAGASSTRLNGPSGALSFDGEVRGVHTLRLSLGAPAEEAVPLPIGRGVVRTAEVVIDAGAEVAARPGIHAEESVAEQSAAEELPPEALATRPVESLRAPHQPVVIESAVAPAAPVPVDLGRSSSPRMLVLLLPDGTELAPDTPVVVGRRPWRTSPEETTTSYILAPSPLRQISGTHLELTVVEGELHARDLDSTNGTLVLTPAQAPRLLHEGRSTALHPGDILDLGEDFRISVGTRSTSP